MEDNSNKKKTEIPDSNEKNKEFNGPDKESALQKPKSSASEYMKKFLGKLTSEESSKASKNQCESSSNKVAALISAAEKRIKEFYDILSKKVSQFLDNDFRKLKNLSKDELTKMNASLIEYKAQLEKISQEKINRIGEIKSQLQTRFMTAEEVQNFVKYIDERMTEMRRITENIIETMRKNEVANNFAKDLQSAVADYTKKISGAMDSLYNALKDTAGDLSRSMPDKKTIMTKMPKMPTTTELQRMPSIISRVFRKSGKSGAKHSGHAGEKPLIPMSLRKKLPNLNLSKYFNAETMYGRANVAKATYATAFLTFLYWKFRHSKS